MNTKIDIYIAEGCGRCPLGGTPDCKVLKWQKEFEALRQIVLNCGLTEEMKWGVPCYTFQGKNVLLLHSFKEYCAIMFFKGALLQDTDKILVQQTENVQATRQIRFTNLSAIIEKETIITAYIYEAIEVEKAGLKINYKTAEEFNVPEEFQQKLAENPELSAAFEALTPGRRKAYLLYFSQPKQAKTRETRIEKYLQQILDGKGLND